MECDVNTEYTVWLNQGMLWEMINKTEECDVKDYLNFQFPIPQKC